MKIFIFPYAKSRLCPEVFLFGVLVFCLMRAPGASAQSMLEYATLLSAQGAADAAQKKDGKKDDDGQGGSSSGEGGLVGNAARQLYDQGMRTAAQRGGALMQQLGAGVSAPTANAPSPAEEEATPSAESAAAAGTQPAQQQGPAEKPPASDAVKVVLQSGQVVEGRLVEKTADYVRIETAGVAVTFFNDEVARVVPAGETP